MARMFAISFFCAGMLVASDPVWAKSCADTLTASSYGTTAPDTSDDLLKRFQFGGLGLSAAVRDQIMRDVESSASMIALIDRANPSQKSSLARGIGEAVAGCSPFQPALAAQIGQMVAQRGDVELMREFRMAQAQAGGPVGTPPAGAPTPPGAAGPSTAGSDKCYAGSAPATPEAIQQVSSNPASLLERFPTGGPALTSEIRNLMVTDASILPALNRIQAQASKEQKTAMAAGLAQAANACQILAPVVTQNIQRFIIALADAELERTFRAITGDQAVGATFAAFGPAPGGGGGGGPISGGGVTTGSQGINTIAQAARASFSFSSTSANVPTTSRQSTFLSVSP